MIPMAGAGSRFADEGYTTPKPLLPVMGTPMVIKAMQALPSSEQNQEIFICRDFHIADYQIDAKLKEHYPNAKIVQVKELTQGQAATCLLAKDLINNDEELVIGASDNGMIYDAVMFESMKQDYDALVFSFRNNQCVVAKPEQYGWIKTNGTDVTGVSVKKAISDDPINDHAIVGSFWFKQGSL
ncbi:MAG: nucleotidyltransferase, partial [Candidatus Melainabacteria bacterium]|nr:nucleotidyltransferase [Candidatus Melainabacteria bacterium]